MPQLDSATLLGQAKREAPWLEKQHQTCEKNMRKELPVRRAILLHISGAQAMESEEAFNAIDRLFQANGEFLGDVVFFLGKIRR